MVTVDALTAELTADDLSRVVNLRPYVNEAALVTLKTTSMRRVSRLFRTMGLRHLLVVENCPKVVGIITRKDIINSGNLVRPRLPSFPEGSRRGLVARMRSRTRSLIRTSGLRPQSTGASQGRHYSLTADLAHPTPRVPPGYARRRACSAVDSPPTLTTPMLASGGLPTAALQNSSSQPPLQNASSFVG